MKFESSPQSQSLKSKAINYLKDKISYGVFASEKEIQERKEKTLSQITEKFGSSIEIEDVHEATVMKHLEHLNLLPADLVALAKQNGLHVKVGYKDMAGLSEADFFKKGSPRGREEKKTWKGVAGAYHAPLSTVYAGRGLHGSHSLVLHEYGHGLGDILRLDMSEELNQAHKRLYKKLPNYLKHGGLGEIGKIGEIVGKQELLAESFAAYFTMTKELFVKKYDEAWHSYLEKYLEKIKDSKL